MLRRGDHSGISILGGLTLLALVGCSDVGDDAGAGSTAGDSGRAGAATSSAVFETAALERADSVVTAWVEEGRIAGAVLSVGVGGEEPMERAYGFAQLYEYGGGQYPGDAGLQRLASPVPMTTGTLFDLASVTKVMATTMAVMLLVDRDELDLSASVSTYLPDLSGGGREAITVEHLLTHRSGLPQWLPTYYHASNPDAAWAYVRTRPLSWAVGEARHYSDLGFMTLGRLVETVSGRGLDDFLRDELYGPLGLDRTGFVPTARSATVEGPFASTSHGNPFERRMVHDAEFGYAIDGDPDAWDGWRRYTLTGEVNDGNAHHAFAGIAGHAGLFAPAGELQVLLRLLLDGGVATDGRRLLERATIDRFLASTGDGQALGWQLPGYAPAGGFGHTGFTGTFVLGVPAEGLSIVLLTNRQNTGVDGSTSYVDVGPLQRAVVVALTDAADPR